MKITSNSALRAFIALHLQAVEPLQGWRRVIEINRFVHWAELKTAFNAIDKVGELTVFNIGANKFRLVADIRFGKQIVLRGKRKLNIRQVRALSERFGVFPATFV